MLGLAVSVFIIEGTGGSLEGTSLNGLFLAERGRSFFFFLTIVGYRMKSVLQVRSSAFIQIYIVTELGIFVNGICP